MEKSVNKKSIATSIGSSISTTVTATGTTTVASPHGNDNVHNSNYLNFYTSSESLNQAKEELLKFQKQQCENFKQQYEHLKSSQNKILPPTLPLIDKKNKSVIGVSKWQLRERSLLEMGFKANEVAGWDQIEQPRKTNLYKLLKDMIDNHVNTNVQILAGGFTFNCHMIVLQCYSDFFMGCSNEILIQLPDKKITPRAFMMIYNWMLTEDPLVQREGMLELFIAANFLGIKELINQCWLCMDDDVRFRDDAAFLLYLEARTYQIETLDQLMLMRICKFFLTLVASKEFLLMSAKEVCTLLSSSTIGVNSEIEIFMSVVRWLSHNWKKRKCHILDLVKCIRFGLMPAWFLVTISKNPENPEIAHIVNHPEVNKMIHDGITYITIEFSYGKKDEDFLEFLERCQLLTPIKRQWIFDKECNYHHRLDCPSKENVTYKSFLKYLEMIQSLDKNYWRTLEIDKNAEKSFRCCTPSDSQKSATPNVSECLRKKRRDQGIQCENDFTKTSNKYFNGGNKTQNKTCSGVSSYRRIPRANPRCTPTKTIRTESEVVSSRQDVASCAYRSGNNQNDRKSHVAKQSKASECININDYPIQPQHQPQRYLQRLSKACQTKKLTNDDNHPVIFKTNETNDKKTTSGMDCCGSSNAQNIDVTSKQHVLHDNDEDVKLHIRSIIDCNDDGKNNGGEGDDADGDNDGDGDGDGDGDCDGDCDGDGDGDGDDDDDGNSVSSRKTIVNADVMNVANVAMPIGKNKEFSEKMQKLFKPAQAADGLERSVAVGYKIIVIGGVDPYCLRCKYGQQHKGKLQDSHMTSKERPKNSIDNDNNSNKNIRFPAYGDQVLIYDSSVLEWRHLSYTPFGSRHHHAAVLCNGFIYVVGGTKTVLGCTKKSSIWRFELTTLKWVFESSLPESRRDFSVIAINEESNCSHCQDKKGINRLDMGLLIIGGESIKGTALNSVWFYSTSRKIWIKKAPLNRGRYGFAAAVVNNEIWVAGGMVEESSTAMADAGDGDGAGACAGAGAEITKTNTYVITDTIEIYKLKCIHESNNDTRTCIPAMEHGMGGGGVKRCDRQWIPLKLRLRMPRLFARFCVVGNGELYLVGGLKYDKQGVPKSLSDIDNLDFCRGEWTHCGDLKWARHGHDVSVINDHCIVSVGGVSTFEKRTLKKVEKFCTHTRTCQEDLPDLFFPLSGCTVVTMNE
uniref:BTB domain-containing protein n=1 Tax=Glossina brevipalpis TaxID=37001 RepID=A0A1A9WFC5_9MUSC